MQNMFTDIDEFTTSGINLANILDALSETLRSGHMGIARPAYAIPGLTWVQVDDINDLSSGIWKVNLFDGSSDIVLFKIDPVNHLLDFGGNNLLSALKISRSDTGSDVLELARSANTSGNSGGFIYTQLNDNDDIETFGKVKIQSSSVSDGDEASSFLIELFNSGVLSQALSLTKTQMVVSALAGSGYRGLVVSDSGQLLARNSEWQAETDYFIGEKIISGQKFYLVISNFTSHASDISNDLANLRLIGDVGYVKNTQQDLVDSGTIVIQNKKMQICELVASVGDASAADTLFGSSEALFNDGMLITLLNLDSSNDITINVSNVDYGFIGNGNQTLSRGHMMEVLYSATEKRFIQKSKNF